MTTPDTRVVDTASTVRDSGAGGSGVPAARICAVNNCDRDVKTRGWCQGHYIRWRRHGDVDASRPLEQRRPIAGRTCSVDGCDVALTGKDARELCQTHYARWRRTGDTTVTIVRHGGTESDRFWAKVDTSGGCWLWTAGLTPDGYGIFGSTDQPTRLAHRWAYLTLVGPIPDGTELDHVCHTRDLTCNVGVTCQHRRCVNPDHLEPVTHVENVARGLNSRRTTCSKGHPRTPEHGAMSGRRWYCRTCIYLSRERRLA